MDEHTLAFVDLGRSYRLHSCILDDTNSRVAMGLLRAGDRHSTDPLHLDLLALSLPGHPEYRRRG